MRLPICLGVSILLHAGLLSLTGTIRTEGNYWLPSFKRVFHAKTGALTVALPTSEAERFMSARGPAPADSARLHDGPASANNDRDVGSRAAAVLADEGPPPLIALPIVRYYKPLELTVKPELTTGVPQSSDLPWPLFQPGRGLVRIFIDENGRVDNVVLTESNLPIEFERMMTATLWRSVFKPGELDGNSVKSQLEVEIRIDSEASTNRAFSPIPSVVGN